MKILGKFSVSDGYNTLRQAMTDRKVNKYVKYFNMSKYDPISTTLEKANANQLMANYLKPYGLSVEIIKTEDVSLSVKNKVSDKLGTKLWMVVTDAGDKHGCVVSREIVAHPDAVYPFEETGIIIRQVPGEQDLQQAFKTYSSHEDGFVRHIYRNLESAVKEFLDTKVK